MSPIASARSAVSTIFGSKRITYNARLRRATPGAATDIALIPYTQRMSVALHLGRDDFVPHLGELRLVAGPHLFLGEFSEGTDIGGVDRHPLRLQELLRLGQAVDAFGQP